jgi:protein-S-isoprenylcysteine O-methyltransferase Ste14
VSSETPKNEPPFVELQIGKWKLTGFAAGAVLILLLGTLVAFMLLTRPLFQWSPLWVCALLWLAFIVYWSAAAKYASTDLRSESASSRKFHQILLYTSLLLLFLRLPGLTARFLPEAAFLVPLGIALQVGFGLIAVWARRQLGKQWSPGITEKVGHQLVRSGPYRFIRHPIYTAMLGMYLGTALVSGELHALLGLLIVSIAYQRKVRLEEQHLRRVFGIAYDEYQARSWALLPGIY